MTQREKLIELLKNEKCPYNSGLFTDDDVADYLLANGVVVPVRCAECVHCVPLDKHCYINSSWYHHCTELHGEEIRNVWHKYKKYYKDYSLVEHDGFCCYGEAAEAALKKMEGEK